MTFNDSLFKTNLWDLADYTNGRPTKPSELVKQGIPIIKIAELSRGITAQTNMVPKHVVDPKHIVRAGDLLFAWSGTIGIHTYDGPEAALNQHIFKVVAKDFIDQAYLRYLLEEQLKVLQGFVEEKKTTMGHVTIANLKTVEVSIPTDLNIQRRIASYIESLDNLLNVEEKKGKILEDIAQTIFKSWFIDFDPVKAKMAGEKPAGMDEVTAALFPDSMEESELGLIPKGWEIKSLDDFADYLNGLAMQKYPVTDNNDILPVIKIAQLRAGNTTGADIASGSLDSRYIINDGDVLFSWSGTLEVEVWTGGLGALNQHLFKVTGKDVPNWFAYLATKGFLPTFRAIASGKATTMGHIQRGHLTEARIALPPLALISQAGKLFELLTAQKVNAMLQNKTLIELRDSLLPRLISGELQIPEEMLAS
jgi:type I restriction enzyme S subunit